MEKKSKKKVKLKEKRKVENSNESFESPSYSKRVKIEEQSSKEPLDEYAVKGAFQKFKISDDIVQQLQGMGVKYLFPVQIETFNPILNGMDVITQARTGTGKTIAFAVPIIERLRQESNFQRGRAPRVLVMAPTRELAKQTGDVFQNLCAKLSTACVYGGTPYGPQERSIQLGLDILVGTPGRILDLVEKRTLNLEELEYVVLDEVDRMLDMGFADIVDDIIKHRYNKNRRDAKAADKNPQTMMFSATLPKWVHQTSRKYMSDNVVLLDLVGRDTVKTSTTVEHLAVQCDSRSRESVIADLIQVHSGKMGRSMVFCETKREADLLASGNYIKQEAHVLHGDIPQNKREIVLKKFRAGRYRCLVTTDVAARGLDIPEIDIVIQCTPPKDVDSYIHRSGRTGRAGRNGISVLMYSNHTEHEMQQVERTCKIKFKRIAAPSLDDVMESSSKDASRSLDDVHRTAIDMFKEPAQELIERRGAVDALAAALAVISGQTQPETRSLINASRGFTTYILNCDVEMNYMTVAWRLLEQKLSYEIKEKIVNMKFIADRKGVVFDLPSSVNEEVDISWDDTSFETLKVATQMPELEIRSGDGYGQRRDSYSSRGSQRGNQRQKRNDFPRKSNWGSDGDDWGSGGGGYGSRGDDRGGYGSRGDDRGSGGDDWGSRGGDWGSRGGGNRRGSYGSSRNQGRYGSSNSRGRGRGRGGSSNDDLFDDMDGFSYAN